MSKDRKASTGLTTKQGLHTCVEYQVTQAWLPDLTLGYPDQNHTVPIVSVYYTVHCIMTVLLNYTISGKIGIDVVT